jgi:hypothetical protein
MTRRSAVVWCIGLVAFAALASYLTTSHTWAGGFPSGEFRLKVVDPDGRPVPGAVLRVFRGGTTTPAFGYPLENHLAGQDLVGDDGGVVTAFRTQGGIQFGGTGWVLFWVIPVGDHVGDHGPRYDCEITAAGFRPLRFPLVRLFQSPFQTYDQFPKTTRRVSDEDFELKVYENTFTLDR